MSMNTKMASLLIIVTILAGMNPDTALAKDTFYYIGYGMVQVVDGDSDAIVADIPVEGWIRMTDFSADKKFLYVVAKRHIIHKIDLAEKRVVSTIDVSSDGWDRFIYGFILAPDGKSAYVNLLSRANLLSRTTTTGEVVVAAPQLAQIDLENGQIMRSIETPWSSLTLVSVKNATNIYVIGKDIVKVDVSGKEMKVIGTYPMFEKGWNMLSLFANTLENGGDFIGHYYTAESMGLVTIDSSSGAITDTPLDGPPIFAYSVIRSPDKKKLYAVMDDLTVIDLETHSYETTIPIPGGTVYNINVSSDGKKIYVSGGGSTTTVYDAESLKPIKVLQMETDGIDFRRLTS
jgi:DNA-binding beta-propeller fold protein YncE